jgi:hypothetical protein
VAKTPEGEVKAHVKALFKAIDAFPFMPVTAGFGSQAVDFIVCWKGLYVAVETKAPGCLKKLTKRQEDFLNDVAKAGGVGVCIDNVDTLVQSLFAACASWSINPPAIFSMTGDTLLKALGFRPKRPLKAKSSSSWTTSASRSRCPISNDYTPEALSSLPRLTSSNTTGQDE